LDAFLKARFNVLKALLFVSKRFLLTLLAHESALFPNAYTGLKRVQAKASKSV
jgi:hypothetical protein